MIKLNGNKGKVFLILAIILIPINMIVACLMVNKDQEKLET